MWSFSADTAALANFDRFGPADDVARRKSFSCGAYLGMKRSPSLLVR